MSINFIGQDSLLQKINGFTVETFPHSFIIYGEKGSGRHMLCSFIAEKFHLDCVDVRGRIGDSKLITKKYSASALRDFLDDCTLNVFPTLIIFEAEDLQEKESAALLKILEEPPRQLYIAIVALSPQSLIPTIKNRAMEFYIPVYTTDTLKLFLTDQLQECFLEYANTPGQILSLCTLGVTGFNDMLKLAYSIFTNIVKATYGNLFNISNRFFPRSEDKFPFEVFVLMLYKTCYKLSLQGNVNYDAMILTFQLVQDIRKPRSDNRLLFEKYLFELKSCLR